MTSPGMTRKRLRRAVMAGVAGVMFVAGLVYAFAHHPTYESTATVLVVPGKNAPHDLSTLLGPETTVETEGTAVELLSSNDVYRRAGSPPVDVSARQVLDPSNLDFPWTNVIELTARGQRKQAIRPALRRIVSVATGRESAIGRVWALRRLGPPTAPAATNPTTREILLASPLFALLGALASSIALRVLLPERARRRRRRGPLPRRQPIAGS
jgi:hypothetical protein